MNDATTLEEVSAAIHWQGCKRDKIESTVRDDEDPLRITQFRSDGIPDFATEGSPQRVKRRNGLWDASGLRDVGDHPLPPLAGL